VIQWYKLKNKDKPSFVSGSQSSQRSSTPTPSTNECPYKLAKACDLCFKKGRLDINQTNRERCSAGHVWNLNIIYVILPLKKVVKRLPFHIPWNNNFTICNFANNCYQGNACQFAHSDEEIRLWKWMVTNKGECDCCITEMLLYSSGWFMKHLFQYKLFIGTLSVKKICLPNTSF